MAHKNLPPMLARAALWSALVPLLGLGWQSALQAAEPAGTQLALRSYDIDAGTLDQVLGRFGRDSGVLVAIDPSLTAGLRSNGLQGSYGERDALGLLLRGSGLEAVAAPEGGYRLRRLPTPQGGVSALAPVLVTADLDRAAAVYETPGSVAVVTREQMDRIPARSIGDVLADVPGVYSVGSRQGGGLSVNIRGMQDFGRVNVMIDGARQNFQQSGHGVNGSAYLDPELLAGVDIAKGPSSSTGGAAVIGGVVNFRTLDPSDLLQDGKTVAGRVAATTGTNEFNFSGSAAVAVQATDEVQLLAAVSHRRLGSFEPGRHGGLSEDGYQNQIWSSYINSQEYVSSLAKISWQASPSHHFKLSYLGFDARRELNRDSSARSRVRRDTLIGNYDWTPANPHFDVATALYYTRTRNAENRDGSDILGYGPYDVRYETSTVGGSVSNKALFDLGGDYSLQWLLGGEFFHDWTDPKAQSVTDSLEQQRAYNSVWFTGSTPKGKRTVGSLFTEATMSYSDWMSLTTGLRYDWYGLEGEGKIMTGEIANGPGVRPSTTYMWTSFGVNRNASAVSPKVTFSVKPWQPVQLFASYGRGMRPPAITETLLAGAHPGNMLLYYPNPGLLEERSRNWELGANLIFDGVLTQNDLLRLKTAWFDNKVRNYMAMAVVKSPSGDSSEGTFAPRSYVNLDDPFRSRGLELLADYDAGLVFASLAYTHMLVNPGDGGYNPFPLGSQVGYGTTTLGKPGDGSIGYMLPPRRSASLSLGVRLLDRRLTLGGRMRWRSPQRYQVSEQFQEIAVANAANAQVLDLWASYEFSEALTLRLAADNLTDRNYSEMSGGSYFLAPGRTVSATLEARF